MPRRLPIGTTPKSNSERAREWRDRQRAQNLPSGGGLRKTPQRKPSLFETGDFVAVDGEGFSEGPTLQFTAGSDHSLYEGREHYYALLAASDGSEIYNPRGRLTTKQCLDFLLAIKDNNPKAILVCFGGSYDVCQMLAHGLTREQVTELLSNAKDAPDARKSRKYLDVTLGQHDYRLEYRARKSLSIWRWAKGADKYQEHMKEDGSTVWRMTDCSKATLWDVWGFFQDSFVGVLDKWLPRHPDYEMIKLEKGNRNIFERSEIDVIRRYNQAELRCLVEVMNKVREAIGALGLTITRWDGAGSIAAAMLKLHEVKQHKSEAPEPVFLAARHAYSGGHIEVCQLGYHDGPVYHYDVNSAYPNEFRHLPSLANGYWQHGTGEPPAGFTVVKTAFQFYGGNSFYPLFYREENGSIIYPSRGCGWYWYPEFEAAREYAARLGALTFEPLEWWHWNTSSPVYPFHWIEPIYERRQELVAIAKATKEPNGEEKVIKLGLNSLYGKTAQQVGARFQDGEFIAPPYFQLEWAGYVTSGCRAKLMQAAIQNPPAIIAFATDGLFSTAPLDLDCPKEKILGAWEFEKHDGITMVMPGVYWLHEDGKKPKHYSRGFDKAQMSDAEFIHTAWRQRKEYVEIDITRLIGLGSACTSDTFWHMRGMFVTSKRELVLNGKNSKRYEVMLYREKPHKGLVPTVPRDHYEDILTPLTELMSAPYDIAWLDVDYSDASKSDPESAMIEEREAIDAELAFGGFNGGPLDD